MLNDVRIGRGGRLASGRAGRWLNGETKLVVGIIGFRALRDAHSELTRSNLKKRPTAINPACSAELSSRFCEPGPIELRGRGTVRSKPPWAGSVHARLI